MFFLFYWSHINEDKFMRSQEMCALHMMQLQTYGRGYEAARRHLLLRYFWSNMLIFQLEHVVQTLHTL